MKKKTNWIPHDTVYLHVVFCDYRYLFLLFGLAFENHKKRKPCKNDICSYELYK